MKRKLLLIILLIFIFTYKNVAQILPLQGRLLNNDTLVNTTIDFEFEILKLNSSIWSEVQSDIEVSNGLYSVYLGFVNPLPNDIFVNVDFVELVVKVNGLQIDIINIYAPIESDPTIPLYFKDGISWSEIDSIPAMDVDSTNELQLLSFESGVLGISNGNNITLPISGDSINLTNAITIGNQDTINQNVIDQDNSTTALLQTGAWQSFILADDLTLTQISIKIANINSTDVRLRIFNGIGTSSQPITNDMIYSSSIITSTLEFQDLLLDEPLFISGGQIYTFEITGTTENILISYNESNPYLYGICSEGMNFDLGFKIQVSLVNDYLLSVNEDVITMTAPEINLIGRVKDKTGFITPVGSIIAYAGASVPEGWLICDGTEVSRGVYEDLYLSIGEAWGSGDNSSTFNLPDLRGRFIRGVDGLADIDPDKSDRTALNTGGNTGNNVGSYQDDEYKSHFHILTWEEAGNSGDVDGLLDSGGGSIQGTSSLDTEYSGGNESRPKNVYVNYIIKY